MAMAEYFELFQIFAEETIIFPFFVFFLGACWGSFANVCIYRWPNELSVVTPGSHCFNCKKDIAWYDNMPILSYFILRGKCRNCGSGYSCRYMLVEAFTGALFLGVWYAYGWSVHTTVYWVVIFGLIFGGFVDLDTQYLPDSVTVHGIWAGILVCTLFPVLQGVEGWKDGLIAAGTGAGIGFGLMWTVAQLGRLVFKKEAMGMGDVFLLGAIGAFFGWKAVLFNLIASSFAGSIVGVGLMALGKHELGRHTPFGPYMALGVFAWMFGGEPLIDWYLGFFTFEPPPPVILGP